MWAAKILTRNRIVQWVRTHPVQTVWVVIITVGLSLALDIQSTISIQGDEPSLIFATLEIIALIIPAFAILLQSILRLSESSTILLIGKAPELRRAVFTVVGFSSIILAIVVYSLSRLLVLPEILDYSLVFTSIVIAGFALIPVYIASLMWKSGYQDVEKGIGQFEFVAELAPILDNPDEVLEEALEIHELDEFMIEVDPRKEIQSKLDEYSNIAGNP